MSIFGCMCEQMATTQSLGDDTHAVDTHSLDCHHLLTTSVTMAATDDELQKLGGG